MAIGNTITIHVLPASPRTVHAAAFYRCPAAAVELPSTAALTPFGTLIYITGTCPLPVTLRPLVMSTIPVPVTGRPFISAPWRRDDLITQRRGRITNNDIEADLGQCLGRNKGGSADSDCYGSDENSFHVSLQEVVYESLYRVRARPQALMHLLTIETSDARIVSKDTKAGPTLQGFAVICFARRRRHWFDARLCQ